MNRYTSKPDNSRLPFPILRAHEPGVEEQIEATFAEATAAAAFGRAYVAPVDRDFTDRKPPGGVAPEVEPGISNPVAALRKKRRVA